MASMQCYRPAGEMYYEEQQQYMAQAQTGACDAGYQMGAYGQHGLAQGPHMGFGQQMGHRQMGCGMGMQTAPGYNMGHQCGSMGHRKQGHGHEMGFGHGGYAKYHEFDGMVYCGKDEKNLKEKKKCEYKKTEKRSHKKKDDGCSSGSDSDSD